MINEPKPWYSYPHRQAAQEAGDMQAVNNWDMHEEVAEHNAKVNGQIAAKRRTEAKEAAARREEFLNKMSSRERQAWLANEAREQKRKDREFWRRFVCGTAGFIAVATFRDWTNYPSHAGWGPEVVKFLSEPGTSTYAAASSGTFDFVTGCMVVGVASLSQHARKVMGKVAGPFVRPLPIKRFENKKVRHLTRPVVALALLGAGVVGGVALVGAYNRLVGASNTSPTLGEPKTSLVANYRPRPM